MVLTLDILRKYWFQSKNNGGWLKGLGCENGINNSCWEKVEQPPKQSLDITVKEKITSIKPHETVYSSNAIIIKTVLLVLVTTLRVFFLLIIPLTWQFCMPPFSANM